VAQTTLASERRLPILELSDRRRRGFAMLMEIACEEKNGRRPIDEDEVCRSIVDIYTRMSALRLAY